MNALLIISFILNTIPYNYKIEYTDMKSCIEARLELERENANNDTFKAVCLPFDKESNDRQIQSFSKILNAFGKALNAQ